MRSAIVLGEECGGHNKMPTATQFHGWLWLVQDRLSSSISGQLHSDLHNQYAGCRRTKL